MDINGIDASIGLAFSLELFSAYKANGILQAPLKNVPGIPKNSIVRLQLVDGTVTACSIQEKGSQPYSIARDMIVRLDNERGPFEWKFTQTPQASAGTSITSTSSTSNVSSFSPTTPPPLSMPMNSAQRDTPPPLSMPMNSAQRDTPPPLSMPMNSNTSPSSSMLPYAAIPKIVARLNWIRLRTWPYEQRQAVYLVWQLIDGQRSVQDIQFMLRDKLSGATTNDVLRFLESQDIITI